MQMLCFNGINRYCVRFSRVPAATRGCRLPVWLAARVLANGGSFDGIAITATQNGYGVVATKEIKKNAEFVRVPVHLAMSERQANASAVIGPVIAGIYADPDSTLAIHCYFISFVRLMACELQWQSRGTRTCPWLCFWCMKRATTQTLRTSRIFGCYPWSFLVRQRRCAR
jgi:hypothetical protein